MIWENISLALQSLRANKMRSLLTMLGIIIGIASVIAIVTIGNAMTASVSSNLSALGTSNITASVRGVNQVNRMMFGGMGGMAVRMEAAPAMAPSGPGGGRTGSGSQSQPEDTDLISMGTVSDLKDEFPDKIDGISLQYSGSSAEAKDGDKYANISITGVNADYTLANNITMLEGRFISERDLDKQRNVAVVSDKFVDKMFTSGQDPLSQQVKIYKSDGVEIYTIVGVYKYEAPSFSFSTASEEDISTSFYIPVTTAKIGLLSKNYQSITVVAKQGVNVISLTEEIQSYFNDLYKTNSSWTVNVSNLESQLETITSTLGTISLAIAFIAGISLLVGGIGVMNIMLVSVTERTREIGTRKALGAKNFHIRFQFVTEAMIVSGIGGIIGVTLGTIIGIVVSIVMDAPITVSAFVVLASVLFSMGIGIFFGYYPANKAAMLDPIEALRYE